ncbi:MAG: peptidylprolyl isomerase [Candidatus Bathyarchaeota archaeon]
MKVLLETSMGNITIQLRDDMPITTENFKNLIQQGLYDGTIFHRVKADFMIQGGDPTGTGYGDPSIPDIQDEFSENPENNKNERGTIAMANTGKPNSGSSQFFINVVYNSHLDDLHPVFGEVIKGMDVVDKISEVATDGDPPTGANKPLEDVTLIRAQFID